MSGPKSSSYYLERERRRELAERRRREQLSAENRLLLSQCTVPAEKLRECEALTQTFRAQPFPQIGTLQNLMAQAKALGTTHPETLSGLTGQQQELQNLRREIRLQWQALQAEEQRFRQKQDTRLRTRLQDTLSAAGSRRLFAASAPAEATPCAAERNRCMALLDALLADADLPDALRPEIQSAQETARSIQELPALRNFYAVTVRRLEQQAAEWKELVPVYEALLLRCRVLCEQTQTPLPDVTPEPSAVRTLQALAEELEQKLQKDAEQAYIRQTIDEVMTEMGYPILGSREVVRKNGRAFRQELFVYEDGTAVDVTFADDGKITMELGGIAESDRLPEDAEMQQLCSGMEHFCKDFTEIERRLAERGVLSRHIACLPPDRAYAQIINLHDYVVNHSTDYTTLQAEHRTSAQTLRAEEVPHG